MGCVQTKSSTYSPPQTLEKLKQENGYVKRENGGRPTGQRELGKLFRQELDKKREVAVNGAVNGGDKLVVGKGLKNDVGNVSQRFSSKKAGGEELVDGWPKWLVDNIAGDVLAGLVPKSADSYDKLAKVSVWYLLPFPLLQTHKHTPKQYSKNSFSNLYGDRG